MPKSVDHEVRRGELADAACRVIARRGLSDTTLAQIADEAGWSIGSIRHYFPDKDTLIAAALWRVGERVDARIRRKVGDAMSVAELRTAAIELLPLDAKRREEALVHQAFLAQAAVVPELAAAADDAARRLHEPLASRIAHAAQTGELAADLDADHEARRLLVLLDGLAQHLVTTPKRTPKKWALAVLDEHLDGLRAPSPGSVSPPE